MHMVRDRHLSKEYRAIEFRILDAYKKNAPEAEIKNLFEEIEQLAKTGDESAMSFIEKAKLATSPDNIKPNTVWKNGGVYHMQKVTVDDDLR